MSLKTRILRILLTVLVVLLFAGYFAFSTFFFPLHEGSLGVDVAALAPRQVDFFVAKAGLGGSFDEFPRPKLLADLERQEAWSAFLGSPEYEELARELQVEERLAELRAATGRLPLGLQPQKVFGGKDLALAGYFRGQDLAEADWAVYAYLDLAGKVAVSALRHPGWIGLEDQGLDVTVEDDFVRLAGGQLQRPLHVARIRDVAIVATEPELIRAALELHADGYPDSVLLSAPYHDFVQSALRTPEREEVEFALKVDDLYEALGKQPNWPDPTAQDMTPRLLGRLFQLGSVKSVYGVAGIDADRNLGFAAHADLTSERVTPDQAKLYRQRGFDHATVLEDVARLAPADCMAFAYLHGTLGDLARMVLESLEPAARELLEDAFRNTGKYANLEQLLAELDTSLKNRAALIVRENDYPVDPQGPPHDDQPVPAVALVLWTESADQVVALRDLIGNSRHFGLQGRNPGEPGYYKNIVEGGFEVYEMWSPFVPGTGVVATANVQVGNLTIVANSFQMLGHILKTYTSGDPAYRSLADDARFRALLAESLPLANLLVWASPRLAGDYLRERVQYDARDAIVIDWKAERARVEEQVLREQFPGQRRGRLDAATQAELDRLVAPRLESIEARVRQEQVPALIAERSRYVGYLETLTGVLAMVALDPRSIDVTLRATTTVGVEPEPALPAGAQ